MIIESKKYNEKCSCGREHYMTTELCIIESGCISKLSNYLKEFGLSDFTVAVYDESSKDLRHELTEIADKYVESIQELL